MGHVTRAHALRVLLAVSVLAVAGCGDASAGGQTGSHDDHDHRTDGPSADRAAAELARARVATTELGDVSAAEAAGYSSTLDTLGCFDSDDGGMGVH